MKQIREGNPYAGNLADYDYDFEMSELAVFYLSYDEPLAEQHWADLQAKAPWARRVHGVKGFDAAHKMCATHSHTARFITVDGDNIVNPSFFWEKLKIHSSKQEVVFSWGGLNVVNGLVYGNGGLKCWTRDIVLQMNTHEAADDHSKKVDFCWDLRYEQMSDSYCTVHSNATPYQAFRAGFREGVKMTLDRGVKVGNPHALHEVLWKGNLDRLRIWCSIGADVENGYWCMYGARLGAFMTNLTGSWDFSLIADYDWFKQFWEETISPQFVGRQHFCDLSCYRWSESLLLKEIQRLGNILRTGMRLDIREYSPADSKFFKDIYVNPIRKGLMIKETDA